MLPQEFMQRMQKMLGDEYEKFAQSLDGERHQALRVNPLKISGGIFCDGSVRKPEEILGERFHMTHVSWEPCGYYYDFADQPGKHPYHEAGVYYIQEPSAMAVVPLMEARPGERILDLCAAPGGKSTQIAAYLNGRGLLVSNEIHSARAEILSENIERMGISNACVTNESPTNLSEKFPEYFDRVLVDAPCSGEGMFRKNEIASEEWSPENVNMCAERQDGILDCAAKMLRPGGRLVYSTCTFAPQENEGTVCRFLLRHPEFRILPIDKERMGLLGGLCDGRPEWGDGREELRGTLRLWPHVVRGEGHFAAVLQKAGDVPEGYEPVAASGVERGLSAKDKRLEIWWEFWRETAVEEVVEQSLRKWERGEALFVCFGDNLYLAPGNMPACKGLKILRPGLHLGTFRKDRFQPSHALALALQPHEIRHACHLRAEDPLTLSYLQGQTFAREGEKGWYLIDVDGYSLGWGKLAGGIMKNHYPKGLRKN